MKCPTKKQLIVWLNDTKDETASHIDEHVKICEHCQSRVHKIKKEMGYIDDLFDFIREHAEPQSANSRSGSSARHSSIVSLKRRGILQSSDDPNYAALLGQYKIKDFQGQGAMGVVLKGYIEKLNRTVALKILRPEFLDDSTLLARFEREARILAGLRHENIITVYAVDEEAGSPYIVMEFVEGETLSARLRREGHLPNQQVRMIFRQILEALHAAHDENLIHRDIKSANILLENQSQGDSPDDSLSLHQRVLLADFGLARLQESRTRLTSHTLVLGTPDYMSPEQARGQHEIDSRSDLYSAGVVLYEMLTGKTPFHTGSPTGTLFRILNEFPESPLPINKEADPQLADMALRLLAKDPDDRFQSAAEAIESLDSGTRISNKELRRRRRSRFLKIASTAIVFLILSVVGFTQTRESPVTDARTANSSSDFSSEVFVRRGESSDWLPVCRFTDRLFRNPCLLLNDTTDSTRIGLGTYFEASSTLFTLLDPNGDILWEYSFSAFHDWPDCDQHGQMEWIPGAMIACQLDEDPSEEIVMSIHLQDCYPTCLVVLDPETCQEINPENRFWHTGQIMNLLLLNDFFAPGHPALMVTAVNNKLDGFGDPPVRPYPILSGEDPPRTGFGKVVDVMILDPRNMGGISPPRNRRIDLQPAYVYSYAWLNLPSGKTEVLDDNQVIQTSPETRTNANHLHILKRTSLPDTYPAVQNIAIQVSYGQNVEPVLNPSFTIDTDMNFLGIAFDPGNRTDIATKQYWEQFWKPVIRHGKYINTGLASDTPHPIPIVPEAAQVAGIRKNQYSSQD